MNKIIVFLVKNSTILKSCVILDVSTEKITKKNNILENKKINYKINL